MQSIRLASLWLILALMGCSTTTRHTMNTTVEFNIGLQRALNEQLLLNIIRLRFREPALFLKPNHLSGEAKVTASGAMGPMLSIDNSGNATFGGLLPGASASREYSPSISFTHVSGESQHYHEEITMELFNHLLKAEWNIRILLALFVERLDNLKNDPRKMEEYHRFLEIADILERTQDANGLVVVPSTVEKTVLSYVPPPPPLEPIHPKRRSKMNVQPPEPRLNVKFSLQELMELEKQGYDIDFTEKQLIVKKKQETGYVVQSANASKEGGSDPSRILTRSFYDALFFLAQAIDVPHPLKSSVKSYGKAYETAVRRLLTVKWSCDCPDNAYIKTEYRDYCWYIEDIGPGGEKGSLSKDTISLLQMVYMLQGTDVSGSSHVLSVVGL